MITALILTLALRALADGPCTDYTSSGVGGRKQALTAAGANALDIAIACQETKPGLNSGYTYGDGKTGDSANFGPFKNNWYAIRTYCSQFAGQTPDQWNNGAALNSDDAAAIQCQHEQINALGEYGFYSSQRNGQSTNDGETQAYQAAINYDLNYINSGHISDDGLPCYDLHAI